MDKRLIYAVAGSGKTSYIVENLSIQKRSLIITYTRANYANISSKICEKFNGSQPKNITLMSYFSFLYNFCYKPFLADEINAKGIIYEANPVKYCKMDHNDFYLSTDRYFYSNRLSLFLEREVLSEIKVRIEKYFDELIIDEVQDIAGRDFNFLEKLMSTNVNMLFVGDFFQHTFDTSRDGPVNENLYKDKSINELRFTKKGLSIDKTTLIKSWRCSQNVCEFIRDNLGIVIYSKRPAEDNTEIVGISDVDQRDQIINDNQIVKLHYQNAVKAGDGHRNWGETKGEDNYQDVCVLLNKNTSTLWRKNRLIDLPPATKNKLYVAITRARGNVYLIDDYL